MAAFNKFFNFVADLASGKHQMQSGTTHVYKVYLASATPSPSNTVYGTPADLSTANGYTAVPCTGEPTTVNVRLDAHEVPLRRGSGVVDASVSVCSAYGPCLQASDRRNVFFL